MNTQAPFLPLQLPVPTLEQSAHGFPAAPAAAGAQPGTVPSFTAPSFLPIPGLSAPAPGTASAPAPGNLPFPFFAAPPPPGGQAPPPPGQAAAPGPGAAPNHAQLLHPAPSMAATATTNASLAYLNDQLARFAATGGMPFAARPMVSSSATPAGPSAPASGASSPGGPGGRNLARTGYSTPGIGLGGFDAAAAFSQLAAAGGLAAAGLPAPGGAHHPPHLPSHGNGPRSSPFYVNGKRLIWSDMICATIAESPQHRLVIQDLFHGMCQKFPEIHEWANGKDWEARVKNRIKSTLSIKSNLFIKVPRPASAAGKGSWWTLSEEAQEMYRSGRLSTSNKQQGVLQSATHHVGHAHHHGAHAHHSAHASRSSSSLANRKDRPNTHAHPPQGHQVGGTSANSSRPASRPASRPTSRTGSPTLSRRSPGARGAMCMTALRPTEAPASAATSGKTTPAASGNGLSFLPAGIFPDLSGLNALAMARLHADGASSPLTNINVAGSGTATPAQVGMDNLSLSWRQAPSAQEVAQWRALFDAAGPFPASNPTSGSASASASAPASVTASASPVNSSPRQLTAPAPAARAAAGDSLTSSGPSVESSSGAASLPSSSVSSAATSAPEEDPDALLRSLFDTKGPKPEQGSFPLDLSMFGTGEQDPSPAQAQHDQEPAPGPTQGQENL